MRNCLWPREGGDSLEKKRGAEYRTFSIKSHKKETPAGRVKKVVMSDATNVGGKKQEGKQRRSKCSGRSLTRDRSISRRGEVPMSSYKERNQVQGRNPQNSARKSVLGRRPIGTLSPA